MVEIWPAVYTSSLQPVYPITSRKILRQEFPSQMEVSKLFYIY